MRGDPGGGPDLVAGAGQFGQAVGPGARVLTAVEPLPGRFAAEPETGAQVDHLGLLGKLRGQRGRLPVRQRHEHQV
jgi:hypothetical protein